MSGLLLMEAELLQVQIYSVTDIYIPSQYYTLCVTTSCCCHGLMSEILYLQRPVACTTIPLASNILVICDGGRTSDAFHYVQSTNSFFSRHVTLYC